MLIRNPAWLLAMSMLVAAVIVERGDAGAARRLANRWQSAPIQPGKMPPTLPLQPRLRPTQITQAALERPRAFFPGHEEDESELVYPRLRERALTPNDAPEFYFTRMVYRENGWRTRRTMSKPNQQYICPEFGGGRFFPQQGWGWATDYPGADCKFMGGVGRLTGVRVNPNPNVVEIMDENLFRYPFLYAVEVGGMELSMQEAARLREYLLRGGFLHVDDFWGGYQKDNFEQQMRKVFPDRPLEKLSIDHPAFHTYYDVQEVMQLPNRSNGCYGGQTWEQPDDTEPAIFGISDDTGRLMMVATYNTDMGDAWEYMDLPCYPTKFSSQAYRVGIGFMIYAMSH